MSTKGIDDLFVGNLREIFVPFADGTEEGGGHDDADLCLCDRCATSAPEGLANLQKHFPRIDTVIAVHDEKLDKHGYIIHGLGDFWDRYFGNYGKK